MPLAPVIFVLGGPGSGKGTNCERLVKEFGFVHISAGDLLREETKKPDSTLGAQISGILARGEIVPSEITVALLTNRLKEYPENKVGFLVDGFPRKADQAKMFEDGVQKALSVLYFDCTEATMESRLLKRAAANATSAAARSDDNEETIRRRFRVNIEQCVPVVEGYKQEGRCTIIDANRDRDSVYKDVHETIVRLGFKVLP